ncbi:hypothetical protein, partial [Streptomyces niveiscabiei]|uniref:hypothetical protein n=1 Tax=Streptomyces niveiscabiei TaxID=164115 RepID=UPI0038F64610
QFVERETFWRQSDLDQAAKQIMLEQSGPLAHRFWQEVDGHFLPALEQGDRAAARASYGRLDAIYVDHRAAIDRLVATTTRRQ